MGKPVENQWKTFYKMVDLPASQVQLPEGMVYGAWSAVA